MIMLSNQNYEDLPQMADQSHHYCVYWIYLDGMDDPETQGYIGVSGYFSNRMWQYEFQPSYNNSNVAKHGFTNCRVKKLFDRLSIDEAYKQEEIKRPTRNIGWNFSKGGIQTGGSAKDYYLYFKHLGDIVKVFNLTKFCEYNDLNARQLQSYGYNNGVYCKLDTGQTEAVFIKEVDAMVLSGLGLGCSSDLYRHKQSIIQRKNSAKWWELTIPTKHLYKQPVRDLKGKLQHLFPQKWASIYSNLQQQGRYGKQNDGSYLAIVEKMGR